MKNAIILSGLMLMGTAVVTLPVSSTWAQNASRATRQVTPQNPQPVNRKLPGQIPEDARKAFDEALAAIRQIEDVKYRDVALRTLSWSQAEAGDRLARKTAALMTDEKERLSTLEHIAGVLAYQGDRTGAILTAAATRDRQQRDSIFGNIAYQQARAGDDENAMHAINRSIRSDEAKLRGLLLVAEAQIQRDDLTAARKTLAMAEDAAPPRRAQRMVNLAQALAVQAKHDEAMQVAQQIKAMRDQAKDENERAALTADYAIALLAANRAPQVQQVIESINKEYEEDRAWRGCAVLLARMGLTDGAIGLCQKISSKYTQSWALMDVSRSRFKKGDHRGALKAAMNITKEPDRRDWALHDVIVSLTETGDVQPAIQMMRYFTKGGDAFGYKASALAHIALAQAKAGQSKEAGETFTHAWQTVWAIHRPVMRNRWLEDLFVVLAQTMDTQAAMKLASEQTDPIDRAAAFTGLGEGLGTQPKVDATMAFATDTPKEAPRPAALRGKVTLHDFVGMDSDAMIILLDRKVREHLRMLESPTQQGQPKSDEEKHRDMEAHRLLSAHFLRPARQGEGHPYIDLMVALIFEHNQTNAYADLDTLLTNHFTNTASRLAKEEKQP